MDPSPSPSRKITRKDFDCPFFGHPRDLPPNELPTYEDVLLCFFEERIKLECCYIKVSFSRVSV